ncbi:MAG: TolC family protein [Candidatus Omnitrophica bacterium]|nr:TolC family protein [Candidatus Omnitrophota bacterium]
MCEYRGFIRALIVLSCVGSGALAQAGDTLTFRDALMQVAGQGQAVKASQKAESVAHEDSNRAKAPLLPYVSAMGGHQHYAYQPTAIAGTQKMFTAQKDFNFAGVTAYQTLYDFGMNGANLKAAREIEAGARENSRRVRNQAALEFITAYFDLLEVNKMILVAREELTSLASHWHDVAIFYREGTVTKSEFLAGRVKFASARQKFLTLKNQRKVAVVRLVNFLSLPAGVGLSIEDPQVHPAGKMTVDQAMASAMAERSELKILDAQMNAAQFREQANRAAGRPALFADGGYNYADNRYQGRNDNWDVRMGVKVNIFDGGLVKADVAKEKMRREQVVEEKKKVEQDIRVEVGKAYWDFKNIRERIMLAKSAALHATENLRVNRVQYKEGDVSSTAVLDAIALSVNAKNDLWRATYEEKRVWARLVVAMGLDVCDTFLKGE